MDSSPGKTDAQSSLPSTGGVKRKAPSLLPAFEPYSSSPGFPRPAKRQAVYSPTQQDAAYQKYPTPIPSSTTGILSSPPVRVQANRPGLQRTLSTVSERAPLAAVRSVTLPENGEDVLMGRSSNSSHIQLSSNRLISRVHIKARYVLADPPKSNKLEIVCCGWNGAKIHCQGQTHELAKDDTFTSSIESAEVMLDVQDARIRVQWPSHERAASESEETDSSWDDETSPLTRARRRAHQMSPLPANVPRLFPTESPTPDGPSSKSFKSFLTEISEKSVLQIYEDQSSPKRDQASPAEAEKSQPSTQSASQLDDLSASQLSELSEIDDSDPDEENDPIIHSFGPFGANISARMASFTAGASPLQARGRFSQDRLSPIRSASPQKRSSLESSRIADTDLMINHIVNQLAFSRLSSTPISVILNNLPASLKVIGSPSRIESRSLTRDELRKLLIATPCIGEIHREGKDAAGKLLESEYYYVPDEDKDVQRKAAVVDGLRKPSLRNCRKQHKQYYWKKPKTP